MTKKPVLSLAAYVFIAGMLTSFGAQAQSAADFYKSKPLTIVVGFTTGGGYDTYARVLARHYNRHIPGAPTIVVQNMPGSGSLAAVRYLDATAPKDGSVMTAFNPGVISESLMDPERIKLKFTDVAWVGSITRDFRVCYSWHTTPVKTWSDMGGPREFVIGDDGIGTGAHINGAILRNLFGRKIRQVTGYPGSAEMSIAIERGELEGQCTSWSSINKDWIRDNKINPLVRFSPVRTPDIPESVPFVGEFATTQEQKDILGLVISPGELGRPYVMSKQVPADRLEALRTAFNATMKDAGFLAEAEKLQLPVNPATAAEAEKIIVKIYSEPQALVEKAKVMIR